MFTLRKQANGRYRWYGSPTNNALDRDGEILSGVALADIVKRIKSSGQYPPLYFFHIRYPVGTTDYMYIVDGVVCATGEINNEPVALAAAQYAMENPDSWDGSGWAMSHEFSGYRDKGGVFHHIGGINELTFLSRFSAANPHTDFGVGVKSMDEQQRKALDMVLGNPALVAVVEQHLSAQTKSRTLNERGVIRKATSGTNATVQKFANGTTPLSLFLKADEPPLEEEEEQKDDMMYEEEMAAADESPAESPAPEAPVVPEAAVVPSGDVASAIAEQIAAPIAEAVATGIEAVAETASVFTPEQQQQIVDLVNTAVAPMQAAMQEMANALAAAQSATSEVKSLRSQVDELTGVKTRNEVPKMTLVDIWKQRATTSPATLVKDDDPVAQKGLNLPDAPQASDMWSAFGFAKEA